MKRPCRNASQTSRIKLRELHPIPLKTFNFNWMKKELNDRRNLSKTLGAVVEHKGEKYLLWRVNEAGKAQLLKPDLTKYSGMPEMDKLTWLYQLPLVYFNNKDYVVDNKQRIISLATGKICSFTPAINQKIIKDASESEIVDIRTNYNMGFLTFSEFYLQTFSAVLDYFREI